MKNSIVPTQEECNEFIEGERQIIKNFSAQDLHNAREKMKKEIKEIKLFIKRRNIEIVFLVLFIMFTISVGLSVSLLSTKFLVSLIIDIFLLIRLNKTLNKIFYLKGSIATFQEEINIYFK